MNILELNAISVSYGKAVAVERADLCVPEGSVVALVGPNGSGKSSLVKVIAGLLRPAKGEVLLRGKALPKRAHEVVKAGIAVVPEGRRIFSAMTVEDNLLVGGYTSGRYRAEVLSTIHEAFPLLYERRRQLGGLLSGGEQQLLAICRALMANPALVVIDEPSLGLSPVKVGEMADVIAGMRDKGLSVLLVEQNSLFALRIAEYAYVLERGRIVEEGSAQVLRDSDYVRQAYLGS